MLSERRVVMKKTGVLLFCLFLLIALDVMADNTSSQSPAVKKQLGFDLIGPRDYGNNFVGVKVRVTNLTDRHIDNAQAGCTLQDENNEEISYEKHYVIKSDEGGLAANTSKEYMFFLYNNFGDYNKIKHIVFQAESITFR